MLQDGGNTHVQTALNNVLGTLLVHPRVRGTNDGFINNRHIRQFERTSAMTTERQLRISSGSHSTFSHDLVTRVVRSAGNEQLNNTLRLQRPLWNTTTLGLTHSGKKAFWAPHQTSVHYPFVRFWSTCEYDLGSPTACRFITH